MTCSWIWPSSEEVNDFPDPVGFDAEWKEWPADLADGPNKYAETFVREYVQNSWDSIQAARKEKKVSIADADDSLTFQFVKLRGKALENFLNYSGLDTLRGRFRQLSEKQIKDARLSESEFVSSEGIKELMLLVCSESGGSGMPGHWKTGGRSDLGPSRLRFALVQTASEKEGSGTGGSWGHGKKAIASASKCRSLLVYTCAGDQAKNADKPGVNNRFIGVTYWRRHTIGLSEHVGLGILGNSDNWMSYEPIENESADAIIRQLAVPGLGVRNHKNVNERGTTYVIIEPTFNAQDLVAALERNWWPLIKQQKLNIDVMDEAGNHCPLKPRSRPELVPFLEAWDSATEVTGIQSDARKIQIGPIPVGSLAVVVDVSESGWSYRDDIQNNTSVVALVRNDMVISYTPSPAKVLGKTPFARGVLNVDRDANAEASEKLKLSEPHLHNEWRTTADNSTPNDSAQLAKKTMEEIHKEVLRVRKKHMKTEPTSDLEFVGFSDVFSGPDPVSKGKPKKKEDRDSRFFRIHRVSEAVLDIHPQDYSHVRISTTAEVSLSDVVPRETEEINCQIEIKWRVMEEGDSGGAVDIAICDESMDEVPETFVRSGVSTYKGKIGRSPLTFTWTSAYFPDDWKVSPLARIEVLK